MPPSSGWDQGKKWDVSPSLRFFFLLKYHLCSLFLLVLMYFSITQVIVFIPLKFFYTRLQIANL